MLCFKYTGVALILSPQPQTGIFICLGTLTLHTPHLLETSTPLPSSHVVFTRHQPDPPNRGTTLCSTWPAPLRSFCNPRYHILTRFGKKHPQGQGGSSVSK